VRADKGVVVDHPVADAKGAMITADGTAHRTIMPDRGCSAEPPRMAQTASIHIGIGLLQRGIAHLWRESS
jgi:hypothetical protein